MALAALVRAAPHGRSGWSALALLLGVLGASLFYGDSVITPAISVLSAVEGLEVAAPGLADAVLPIGDRDPGRAVRRPALRHPPGRAAVRPGDGGLVRVARRRRAAEIVAAPGDPARRCRRPTSSAFVADHPYIAFIAMGAVVLAITGAEALYADMGHFGRAPDPARLVLLRLPGADAELPRPGRADPRRPEADRATRSSCWRRVGAHADGGAGHAGHRDRLAGGHLRRVLGVPAGGAAGLPAAT